MKVIVNGIMYDPNEIPVVIVFKNDDERTNHGSNILNYERKEGARYYVIFPDGTDGQKALDDAKDMYEN